MNDVDQFLASWRAEVLQVESPDVVHPEPATDWVVGWALVGAASCTGVSLILVYFSMQRLQEALVLFAL